MDDRQIEEIKIKVKKRRKRRIIIVSIIAVLLVLSVIFALINMFNDKVITGVTIDNITVSGKTKNEISEEYNALIEKNKEKNIVLKYNETEVKIKPEDIDAIYDINDSIDKAFLVGRDSNVFVNNFNIIKTLILKTNIKTKMTYDEQKLKVKINEILTTIPGAVEQYDYYIEDENLIITKGKPGIDIKRDELIKQIEAELRNYHQQEALINVPTYNAEPEKIDVKKVHDEIYKEAADAYIEHDPLVVHPHVNGVDYAISMEEVEELLKEDKEEYVIPLKITVPEKTLANLGEEAFPDLLGEYSTRYDNSQTNRSNNVKLASQKINGVVVLPGETFSYNQTVGKRTIAAGFKEAGAYVGGKVVQEVGGGICQVSSTLYNAVLYANLEIVERYNHCFQSSYVPVSRDATVSWGSCDFKFKNTRTYPVKIVATSSNGVQNVKIYGIKESDEPEVIITSETTSTIDRPVKYIDDSSMDEGDEEIEQTGHGGCTGVAYRILKKDGEVISKTLLSRDTYQPLEKIIRRGTRKVSKPSTPTNTEPVNQLEPEPENNNTQQEENSTETSTESSSSVEEQNDTSSQNSNDNNEENSQENIEG